VTRKKKDKEFADLTQDIDVEKFRVSVRGAFADFSDPRAVTRCVYPAWFMFLVILSGYLAGCNTIADIAHFAELREPWFANLSGLSIGVPSYNTLWWFLVRVRPAVFKALITKWFQHLDQHLKDQLLVIDGKRLRGVSDSEHVAHIVELFAAEKRLIIAQERVPDKAGERQALPALLDSVDVKGAIVTMDALYAHIADVEEVLRREADYIVGIKGNQGTLEAEVRNFFEQADAVDYEDVPIMRATTVEKSHGRIEERTVCVTNDLEWLPQREQWHLQSLIEVRSQRTVEGQVERAIRYYGSSRRGTADQFMHWIREHWSIEVMHHVMDVVFEEDASLGDSGASAENMSLIRRLAGNVIQMFDPHRGITNARRCATYEPAYLRGLLGKVFVK
jgi:predicted transposase YbfD/YdcC